MKNHRTRDLSGWLNMPDFLLQRTDLNLTEKVILCVIARRQGRKAQVRITRTEIATQLGVTVRTVERSVRRLVTDGELKTFTFPPIQINGKFFQRANAYSVPSITSANIQRAAFIRKKEREKNVLKMPIPGDSTGATN